MTDEIASVELLGLIDAQRRDAEHGHRRPPHPMEILAGLNPWGMKRGRPRYFRSGRLIHRRPQGRKGAVVEHGTPTRYRYGCRCEPCRLAHSKRRKAQRRRRTVLVRQVTVPVRRRRWCRMYGCWGDAPDGREFCDAHAFAGGEG